MTALANYIASSPARLGWTIAALVIFGCAI